MTINTIELDENDVVMVHHNIGNMPASDVDKYMDNCAHLLGQIFGTEKTYVFPVREGDDWTFTIVTKPDDFKCPDCGSPKRDLKSLKRLK